MVAGGRRALGLAARRAVILASRRCIDGCLRCEDRSCGLPTDRMMTFAR
jgi:hypothetical protein